MHIPKLLLNSSREYSPDSRTIHQSFAKKYLKSSKGQKPIPYSTASSSSSSGIKQESQPSKLQSDIFNWLFALDLPSRMKVCSIHSKWISKLLLQLSLIYKYDPDVSFQLRSEDSINNTTLCLEEEDDDDDDDNDKGIFFTHFYQQFESQIRLSKDKELQLHKAKEGDFFQMIQCISYKSSNDTLLLKKAFLSQRDKLEAYFKVFSDNQVFTSWLSLTQEDSSKLFNFSSAKWLIPGEKYSLMTLFVSYFESSILIHYQYYYYTKQMYEFPHYAKLNEMLESNKLLELFLKEEKIQDSFETSLLDGIIEKIQQNKEARNEMKMQKIVNKKIFHLHFKSSYYLGENVIDYNIEGITTNLKETCKRSIEQFIEMITFTDLVSIFNFNVFIYKELHSQIESLCVNKNISDLLIGSGRTKESKPSQKKKKKKKGKKGKESSNENETEGRGKAESDFNSNVSESTKEGDSVGGNKSNSSQEKKSLNNESEQSNENSEDLTLKGKSIKQKKPLYLYPLTKKHKEKSLPTNNLSTNKQSLNEPPNLTSTLTESKPKIELTNKLSQHQSNESSSIKPVSDFKEHPFPFENDSTLLQANHLPITLHSDFKSSLFPSTIFSSKLQMYPHSIEEAFLSALSLDITSFAYSVIRNNALLKPYKEKYKLVIEDLIHSALEAKYNYHLLYFGSYVSNLSLENSDIDIHIVYKAKSKESIPIETILNELVASFTSNTLNQLFDFITPISTASIPVIKLQCDYAKDIDSEIKQAIEFDYLFSKDELFKAKFDISFIEDNDEAISIPSQKRNEYIKESMVAHGDIKPLLIVMKRLMQKEKLNSSFKGGLSSYSLFLMILSYLKYLKSLSNEKQSLGYILYHLLNCYGVMDYGKYSIDSRKENPFISQSTDYKLGQVITIIDPVTGHNVAKSSFRVEEIQAAFQKGENYLRQCSFNYGMFGHVSSIKTLLTSIPFI